MNIEAWYSWPRQWIEARNDEGDVICKIEIDHSYWAVIQNVYEENEPVESHISRLPGHPPLLPCPFCGSKAQIVTIITSEHPMCADWRTVECTNPECHAEIRRLQPKVGFGYSRMAELGVALTWNRRQ